MIQHKKEFWKLFAARQSHIILNFFSDLHIISCNGLYISLLIRKQYSGMVWYLVTTNKGSHQICSLRNIQNARKSK